MIFQRLFLLLLFFIFFDREKWKNGEQKREKKEKRAPIRVSFLFSFRLFKKKTRNGNKIKTHTLSIVWRWKLIKPKNKKRKPKEKKKTHSFFHSFNFSEFYFTSHLFSSDFSYSPSSKIIKNLQKNFHFYSFHSFLLFDLPFFFFFWISRIKLKVKKVSLLIKNFYQRSSLFLIVVTMSRAPSFTEFKEMLKKLKWHQRFFSWSFYNLIYQNWIQWKVFMFFFLLKINEFKRNKETISTKLKQIINLERSLIFLLGSFPDKLLIIQTNKRKRKRKRKE